MMVPGFALHDELRLMEQLGMSPYETIRTATSNAAEAIDKSTIFGTIEIGKRADLLLLGSNPFETVANLSAIEGVSIRGVWLSPELIDLFMGRLEIILAHEEDIDVLLIERDMQVLTDAVVAALTEGGLDLAFVHYRHPDSTGHAEGWMSAAYLEKVSEVDGLIGQVVDALGALSEPKRGTILLTADHGGEGTTHFLPTSPTVDVPWLLVGAEAISTKTLTGGIEQNDLAPTVLALLGIGIPDQMNGRVVAEAFADPALAAPFLGPTDNPATGCGTGLLPAFALSLTWLSLRSRRLLK